VEGAYGVVSLFVPSQRPSGPRGGLRFPVAPRLFNQTCTLSPVTQSFRTLSAPFEFEIDKIKNSRFLSALAPTKDEESAKAFVQEVRERYSDARHHCFAWRLGETGAIFRSSDDGEPSGSAGRPILNQLEGHEVTNLTCVVVRWFGGVKLGVGGLVRAYGGAAGKALDRAPILAVVIRVRVLLEFPYDCSGAVSGVLHGFGLQEQASDYGEVVRLELAVPKDEVPGLKIELVERTGGRVRVDLPGD